MQPVNKGKIIGLKCPLCGLVVSTADGALTEHATSKHTLDETIELMHKVIFAKKGDIEYYRIREP